MIDSDPIPQIGQIVSIKSGHDSDQYAIIVRLVDERYVHICDGVKRKFDHPKKKNIAHLRFFDYISSEVQSSIHETGRVTNGKIRHALTIFMNQNLSDKEKGDKFDGKR